jgi:hypothetical protein
MGQNELLKARGEEGDGAVDADRAPGQDAGQGGVELGGAVATVRSRVAMGIAPLRRAATLRRAGPSAG